MQPWMQHNLRLPRAAPAVRAASADLRARADEMSVVRGRASHSLPLRCGKAPDNQTVAAGHDLAEAMTFITFSEGWLLQDACRLAALEGCGR